MKNCENCGQEILDYQEIISKYPNPPKFCTQCRIGKRGYREQKTVSYEELGRWENVVVQSINLRCEEEKINDNYRRLGREFVAEFPEIAKKLAPIIGKVYKEDIFLELLKNLELSEKEIGLCMADETKKQNNGIYFRFSFGGRFFGGSWGGSAYSEKFLFHIQKSLFGSRPPKTGLLISQTITIRKMRKTDTEKQNSNEYFVIEPYMQIEGSPEPQYLYYLENYYKTTLKGYGKDRNLTHEIESEHEILCEVSSSARSGRFGNCCKLIISPDCPLQSEEKGVA